MITNEHVRVMKNGGKVPLCQSANPDGQLCKNLAIKDRDYCKYHGGKALMGPDNPAFKTGLWSKQRRRFASVAPKLLQRIEELREDPELFSLKDDAAYLTALMDIRAEAASNGISVEHYEEIKDQMAVCKATQGTEEFPKASIGVTILIFPILGLFQAKPPFPKSAPLSAIQLVPL